MAEHLRLINPDPTPAKGRFVMTATATDILRSLRLVHGNIDGYGTMIAASPGVGKTETLLHYVNTVRRAVLHTAVAGEVTPWSLAFGLMRALDIGEPNSRQLAEDRLRIAEAVGAEGMLIVDEAQNLVRRSARGGVSLEAVEWLREMARDGCFALVLCGDLKLLDVMAQLPQLRSRMRRPVVVGTVPKQDVALVAERMGVCDAPSIDALALVARHHGGLRDVGHVLAHARIFARGGAVELGHILAAIEDLKLQPKGGK